MRSAQVNDKYTKCVYLPTLNKLLLKKRDCGARFCLEVSAKKSRGFVDAATQLPPNSH